MSINAAVVPADDTACGSYRLRWVADSVRRARPSWQVTTYRPNQIKLRRTGSNLQVAGLDPRGLDLLVLQRVGLANAVAFLEWATQHGTAVVVDVDDAMWCIDPENRAHRSWNNRAGMHWRWLDKAAETADLTTVTTDALARRYGRHGRVEVLPNRVPRMAVEASSIRHLYAAKPVVGWAGITHTHPRDLQVVGDSVQRVLAATGAGARVIGDAAGAARDWALPTHLVEKVQSRPLGPRFYSALTTIDVGLVPLEDNPFNRAKSFLKALEFSAVGVPVIASPTPANQEFAKHVPILLAETPDEWHAHMSRLVEDPGERAERGAEARKLVERDWTIDDAGDLWATAWERAVHRRRRLG